MRCRRRERGGVQTQGGGEGRIARGEVTCCKHTPGSLPRTGRLMLLLTGNKHPCCAAAAYPPSPNRCPTQIVAVNSEAQAPEPPRRVLLPHHAQHKVDLLPPALDVPAPAHPLDKLWLCCWAELRACVLVRVFSIICCWRSLCGLLHRAAGGAVGSAAAGVPPLLRRQQTGALLLLLLLLPPRFVPDAAAAVGMHLVFAGACRRVHELQADRQVLSAMPTRVLLLARASQLTCCKQLLAGNCCIASRCVPRRVDVTPPTQTPKALPAGVSTVCGCGTAAARRCRSDVLTLSHLRQLRRIRHNQTL